MTFNRFNIRLVGIAVVLATVSAIGGVAFWKLTQARTSEPASSLLVLPEPRVVSDFNLVDQHAQAFTLADLRDKWSLIFFGFTNCPDVCPGTLFDLHQIRQNLQQALHAETELPQFLFISVDPERDSPAKLEQYLSYFDTDFIGLTGEHAQLLPLTRELGIAYRISAHDPAMKQYDVAHSVSILLINPQGRLYGVLPAPHDVEKISADLLAIIGG